MGCGASKTAPASFNDAGAASIVPSARASATPPPLSKADVNTLTLLPLQDRQALLDDHTNLTNPIIYTKCLDFVYKYYSSYVDEGKKARKGFIGPAGMQSLVEDSVNRYVRMVADRLYRGNTTLSESELQQELDTELPFWLPTLAAVSGSSGNLTPGLDPLAITRRRVYAYFYKKLDRDRDGYISTEEFKDHWYKAHVALFNLGLDDKSRVEIIKDINALNIDAVPEFGLSLPIQSVVKKTITVFQQSRETKGKTAATAPVVHTKTAMHIASPRAAQHKDAHKEVQRKPTTTGVSTTTKASSSTQPAELATVTSHKPAARPARPASRSNDSSAATENDEDDARINEMLAATEEVEAASNAVLPLVATETITNLDAPIFLPGDDGVEQLDAKAALKPPRTAVSKNGTHQSVESQQFFMPGEDPEDVVNQPATVSRSNSRPSSSRRPSSKKAPVTKPSASLLSPSAHAQSPKHKPETVVRNDVTAFRQMSSDGAAMLEDFSDDEQETRGDMRSKQKPLSTHASAAIVDDDLHHTDDVTRIQATSRKTSHIQPKGSPHVYASPAKLVGSRTPIGDTLAITELEEDGTEIETLDGDIGPEPPARVASTQRTSSLARTTSQATFPTANTLSVHVRGPSNMPANPDPVMLVETLDNDAELLRPDRAETDTRSPSRSKSRKSPSRSKSRRKHEKDEPQSRAPVTVVVGGGGAADSRSEKSSLHLPGIGSTKNAGFTVSNDSNELSAAQQVQLKETRYLWTDPDMFTTRMDQMFTVYSEGRREMSRDQVKHLAQDCVDRYVAIMTDRMAAKHPKYKPEQLAEEVEYEMSQQLPGAKIPVMITRVWAYLLSELDKDDSGKISLNEFKYSFQKLYSKLFLPIGTVTREREQLLEHIKALPVTKILEKRKEKKKKHRSHADEDEDGHEHSGRSRRRSEKHSGRENPLLQDIEQDEEFLDGAVLDHDGTPKSVAVMTANERRGAMGGTGKSPGKSSRRLSRSKRKEQDADEVQVLDGDAAADVMALNRFGRLGAQDGDDGVEAAGDDRESRLKDLLHAREDGAKEKKHKKKHAKLKKKRTGLSDDEQPNEEDAVIMIQAHVRGMLARKKNKKRSKDKEKKEKRKHKHAEQEQEEQE